MTNVASTREKMTGTKTTSAKLRSGVAAVRTFAIVAMAFCFFLPGTPCASAQDQPAATKMEQGSKKEATKDQTAETPTGDQPSQTEAAPKEHQPTSIGGELAKETRVAEGEEEEEHSDLKHSAMVQRIARLTGMSVHGAHLLALILNFAIIVALLAWALGKSVPGIMRTRNDSIRKALDEARAASQNASQRLADIENRLTQMDSEIARMQASAEKDAEGEEARIKRAAEDDLKKIIQSAEQEIAAAAKQVRRDLSAHTADLALALARKQINVDANTDQVLVRNFAARLAEPGKPQGNGGGKDGH